MNSYEINNDTLAILPLNEYKSKVIEKTKTVVVDLTPMKIIENSCAYFGSSYQGRFLGTKNLQNYKKGKDNTTIIFNNGHLLNLDISYGSLDNQVLRAARLESVLRLRKNNNFL